MIVPEGSTSDLGAATAQELDDLDHEGGHLGDDPTDEDDSDIDIPLDPEPDVEPEPAPEAAPDLPLVVSAASTRAPGEWTLPRIDPAAPVQEVASGPAADRRRW